MPDRIWVIDTSSVIEVRRAVSKADEKRVLHYLGTLVGKNRLFFPKQVLDELEREVKANEPDPRYLWAKAHSAKASQHDVPYDRVKEVLARVPSLVDPNKTMGVDEADPYVVALATHIRDGGERVTVVTQDRRDTPGGKTSLQTACGLWDVSSVPLLPFLELMKIWP